MQLEAIRALPKAEGHIHLGGSFPIPGKVVLFDNLEKIRLFWFSRSIYSERLFGATECRHALSHQKNNEYE